MGSRVIDIDDPTVSPSLHVADIVPKPGTEFLSSSPHALVFIFLCHLQAGIISGSTEGLNGFMYDIILASACRIDISNPHCLVGIRG